MKVGDIVRFKTGSPSLAVVEIREGRSDPSENGIVVQWWNGQGFSGALLPPEVLLSEEEFRALYPIARVPEGIPTMDVVFARGSGRDQ
jgi:uncharacterized protein YodC (DUF2158 family)